MNGKYQSEDRLILDYDYQILPNNALGAAGHDVYYRGPAPLNLAEGGYVACIGGSQTMGRFVATPYPLLVGKALGMESLNLGHGGGKPQYFLQSSAIIEHANRAACVIVQIMTARGVENSVFEPVAIHNAQVRDKRPGLSGGTFFSDVAYNSLLEEESPEFLAALLAETRQVWLQEMTQLLQAVRVPKILLWFSTRDPDTNSGFRDRTKPQPDFPWFVYPHFINRNMVRQLVPLASDYVEYVGHPGLPQPLLNRFDGTPVHVFSKRQRGKDLNKYYPSPEMHAEAAVLLAASCRRILG